MYKMFEEIKSKIFDFDKYLLMFKTMDDSELDLIEKVTFSDEEKAMIKVIRKVDEIMSEEKDKKDESKSRKSQETKQSTTKQSTK